MRGLPLPGMPLLVQVRASRISKHRLYGFEGSNCVSAAGLPAARRRRLGPLELLRQAPLGRGGRHRHELLGGCVGHLEEGSRRLQCGRQGAASQEGRSNEPSLETSPFFEQRIDSPFTDSFQLVEALQKDELLQLVQLPCAVPGVSLFDQRNTKPSRKQILPLVQMVLSAP